MLVIHVIVGLNNGGAVLCKYDKSNKHIVISMMDYGSLLINEVHTLNMKITFKGVVKLLHFYKPSIVQTCKFNCWTNI